MLFTTIHEILFHGNGGYDYMTIYNMPIWLRKFTYNKLKEYYDESKKQNENLLVNEENPNIVKDRSDILKNINKDPTYVLKAPKN